MSECYYELKLIERWESEKDPITGYREQVTNWYWNDHLCEEDMGPFESPAEAMKDYLETKKLDSSLKVGN